MRITSSLASASDELGASKLKFERGTPSQALKSVSGTASASDSVSDHWH